MTEVLAGDAKPVARVPVVEDAYPMSELQLGMVYEMERDPDRLPYHDVNSVRVPGRFDERSFRSAVEWVVSRHAVLRTSFALTGFSEPVQLVYDFAEIPITVADLRGTDARAGLLSYLDTERRTPFDVTVAPMYRMAVHVLSDEAFQWTVAWHHAILDGWSLASVVAEVAEAYQRLARGAELEAVVPQSTYRDFVAAEREALKSPETRAYWLERLAESPDSRLPRWPVDRPALLGADPVDGQWCVHDGERGYGSLISPLPPGMPTRLREAARQCAVPVKSVLLAAHVKVMSLLTGSPDVVVGLTANGRLEEAGGTEVCGLFVNTLPFRLSLPDGSWRDLIRAVAEAERELLPHRRYPMAAIQRDLGGHQLFETNFVYTDFQQIATAGEVIVGGEGDPAGGVHRTHFGLVVSFARAPGSDDVHLELEYDAREFPAGQIAVLRDYYLRVLGELTAEPAGRHRWTRLSGAAEQAWLASWNGTVGEVPAEPVHKLFEERAAAFPAAVAVESGGVSLTCGELNARANQLARRLRDRDVGVETAVGVCVERSVEMVVSWLAVLKAGGMYVPLDPDLPSSRLRFMLEQAEVSLVLATEDSLSRVPGGSWRTLVVTGEQQAPRTGNVDGGAGPDNGCYVIFTSGSTGRPKGVVTRHRNVTELLNGGDTMALSPEDALLQIAPANFDVSTFEVWAPLVAGARLVLAPAQQYGPAEIAAWADRSGITVLHATASLFALLVDHEPQVFDGLRRFLTGSETVSPGHVVRILERCPDLELVNCWGPTETTTFSVCGAFRRGSVPAGALPLGVPLVNTEVWVVDEAGMPVPVGSPGELCVSGPCLARGYLGRPGLTAERFVPHPFSPGERMYRTGDRGRWSADGQVEFLGRTDHLVKVRGYRVELGEVEAALRDHPALRECVVVTRPNDASSVDLVAYLVADGPVPPAGELRGWLGQRLPTYMVPRLFVFLDELPLTPRGKVDRLALPEPGETRPDVAQEYVAPVGAVEELLAGIWRRVLRVERVGRHDNFFELGGDSIRSIQVLGHVREAGLAAGLAALLADPTPAGLAAALSDAGKEPRSEPFSLLDAGDRALLPDDLADAYPMTQLQVGMVYEMERDRARNPYHNVTTLRLAGRFDEACFQAAVEQVVTRHPVLRTSFDLTRFSEPVQLVHRAARVPFAVTDLRRDSADERLGRLRNHVRDEQRTPFDLTEAPLFRMAVHVLSDHAFQWTVTEHHAILDGWSLASTVSEIIDLYHRLLAGEQPAVVPLRSVYRDFVAAERAALNSADSRGFWRDRLASAPEARLPPRAGDGDAALTDEPVRGERHDRDEVAGHGVLTTPLPAELRRGLEEFAGRAAVPLKSAVLAAHLKAISVLTGSADVLIGLTADGRLEETDGAEARGLFLNTVPLSMRLPEGSWQHLARAVFRAERELLPHRRYPMAALQREFGRGGPLLEMNFTYSNFRQIVSLASDGALDQADADLVLPGVARTNFPVDVTISHEPGNDGLHLEIGYALEQFTASQAARLRDYHLRAMRAMVLDGEAHHRATSLLGVAEQRLLGSWQGTDAPVSGRAVHELLRERAEAWPDVVALDSGDERLTFAELDTRSEGLAARLVLAGVRRGDLVGLHLRPGVEAIVAVWGVWKAGGGFLPLDPDLPAARLEVMLQDAVPAVVVSQDASAVPGAWPVVPPESCGDAPEVRLPRVLPEDLAYVMYTSGSTGRPKGVMIDHRGLANFAEAQLLPRLRGAGIEPGQHVRVLAGTSAFISDFFLEQLLPLLDGHCLLFTGAGARDPRRLVDRAWDPRSAVAVLNATTSQVQLMVEAGLLESPHPPRLITIGGEACPSDLWDALRSRPGVVAHNTYGPAEATVDATVADLGAHASPVVGRPYGNARVHLVDEGLAPVPPGSAGEIVIGGPGVGRGYVRRPGATAAVFVPDPWGPPGSRLYRTGDLGRYTVDGQIEFLGRDDHQVKILGQRVEPEEVEAVLRSHPAIGAAAVSAHRFGESGAPRLVAHLVAATGAAVERDELRGYLAARLPAAAVPTVLVPVDALPMTAGGKLDRSALTVPEKGDGWPARRDVVAPRTGTEERVAGIWQALLEVSEVGVHDDFFALGGHSLLAVRLAMRVGADLRADLPLHEVFARPTVAEQAELIDLRAAGVAGRIPRHDHPAGRDLPASHAQERQWFLWQLAPDEPTYNVPWGYEVRGDFDPAVLGASVDALSARHEALRTTLHPDADGQVVQRIGPVPDSLTTAHDVDEADLPELIDREKRRPFDLSAGPMLRVHVWRTAADRHVVLFVAHHVVVDEWSIDVLERELWALYRAGGDAGAAALPPLALRYTDYAVWHRGVVAGRADEDLAYWRSTLDGVAPSSWPRSPGVRRENAVSAAGGCSRTVPEAWLDGLNEVRARTGATEFMLYLAVYFLLIARASGDRDITVGIPVSGRDHPGLAPVVGFFVNTLVLRVTVHPEDDFAAHLERVRSAVVAAFAHQEAPFEHVVRAIAPDRADGVSPLFRTMFVYNSGRPLDERLATGVPAGLTLRDLPLTGGGNQFDLVLGASRTAAGLGLSLEHGPGIFEERAAGELLATYTELLRALSETPEAAVAGLLRPSPPELERVLGWSHATAPVPGAATVPELVADAAGARPGAVALTDGAVSLTYQELERRAELLARVLRDRGAGPEVCVGVLLERSWETVVACLAVLKAGGVYVPLDPAFPAERVEFMLRDVGAPLVVAHPATADLVPDGPWALVDPADAADEAVVPDVALPAVGPDHGCYVIFTSGSTGRPKGTEVTHRNVVRLVRGAREYLPFGADDVWSLFHSFAFDFSVWEMWGALTTGGRLVVVPAPVSRDVTAFHRLVRDEAVTILSQTPSAFRQFETADERLGGGLALRAVVFGGEALHRPSVRRWASRHGYAAPVLLNMYGITETTVHVTCLELDAGHVESDVSPIGRPLPDLGVYVLDRDGVPCAAGIAGELCVSGAGLARGYVGRPALTAERFIPDHLSGVPGARLYRSGDLARWNAGGGLEYLGRADNQVKIRGYRIETGEIENLLGAHPGLLEVVVAPHTDGDGRTDLVAYLVPSGTSAAPGADELRTWLGRHLPGYMIPRHFVVLTELPLTPQGKVDRRRLTGPAADRPVLEQAYVPPRGDLEKLLAARWRRVLEVDRVGRHDNFFALGGHSLLAVRLTTQLGRDLGSDVPLAHLYTAPTIAGLAARLTARRGTTGDRGVVPLGGVREARPLVLVHPIGGTLFSYLDLLDEVKTGFEVFGVQGRIGGEAAGAVRIAGLAERYAGELAGVLGDRSPVIAGWSAGGLIAHELARALAGRGIRVHRLVLVDSDPRPADDEGARRDAASLDALCSVVADHGPAQLLRSGEADRLFATLGVDPVAVGGLDGPTTAALMTFWRDMLLALAEYRPARFDGPAELVVAGSAGNEALIEAWRELTGPLSVTHTDADHYQLLRRPWVKAVADALHGSAAQTGD